LKWSSRARDRHSSLREDTRRARRQNEPVIEYFLLGTIHLDNPGADQFNPVVDDVLSAGRQAELEDLAALLVAWRPTKVAVEALPGVLDAAYEAYRRGEWTLGRSEAEQIGFRVAAKLGHSVIFGADHMMDFGVPELEELIVGGGRPALLWEEVKDWGDTSLGLVSGWLRDMSISGVLRRLNEPVSLADARRPYLSWILQMRSPTNDAGPRMVANWYERNPRILANVSDIAEDGDRVLVIFGHGHVGVLDQLLRGLPEVQLADPTEFLAPA